MTAIVIACAVCGYVTPEQEGAVLTSTLGMTILPLALIFGMSYWVMRQYRKPKAEFRPVSGRDAVGGQRHS